jgi:signal peptidase I
MADDETPGSAHPGDSGSRLTGTHAASLESDAAARNGELAESLALDDASAPNGDRREAAVDGARHEPAVGAGPAVGVEPAAGTEPAVASATDADADRAALTDGPPAEPPSRWQFWRRGDRPKQHKKAPWWELPVLIAVAIAVAVVIKTFLIQPFYIPSESMEKTLHGCPGCSGDRVLVNKLILDIRDPHPGDIIVFRAPANWDEEPTPKSPSNPIVKGVRWFGQLVGFVPPDEKDLIKRVIAVGGQTVQCCDAQGRVQVSNHGVTATSRGIRAVRISAPSARSRSRRVGCG